MLRWFVGAALVAELIAAAAAALAPATAPAAPAVPRSDVCQVCSRECSVSCFVGTCGVDYPVGVQRFAGSPWCSSCDLSVAASVSGTGEFQICTPVEAQMPAGATIPAGSSDKMQALLAHSVAEQVKTATTLQAVQSSHESFLRGAQAYRDEMLKLSAEEVRVTAAAQEMVRLSSQESAAKSELGQASAAASQAMQDIMVQAAVEAAVGAGGAAGGGAVGAGGAAGGATAPAQAVVASTQAELNYKQKLLDESKAAMAYKRAKLASDATAAAVPKAAMLLARRSPKVQQALMPDAQGVTAHGHRAADVPHLQSALDLRAAPILSVQSTAVLGPSVEFGTEQGQGISAGAWFET